METREKLKPSVHSLAREFSRPTRVFSAPHNHFFNNLSSARISTQFLQLFASGESVGVRFQLSPPIPPLTPSSAPATSLGLIPTEKL